MKRYFFILAFFALLKGCGAQEPTCINCGSIGLNSITVTATPTTIIAGGTTTLTAQAIDSNNTPNIFLTNQCAWTSSNTAIFTVNGPVATGVATGSAGAVCTVQTATGPVTGSVTITVSNSPIITNPSCAVQPCILPPGTQSSAYSPTFQFACVTSSIPVNVCTWAVTTGSVPAGMALSSGGVLSGTPSGTGTTLFTVTATDGASNTGTQQESITINAAATCGPPNYPCSTTTTANPGPITAPFSSSLPSGVVSIQNTSTGGCTADASHSCMTYVSGTNFVTTWPTTKELSINGGAVITVTAWNSTTVATVNPVQTTATNVSYLFKGACITSGTGCQNATGNDTTLNPSSIDCITQLTDQATNLGGSFSGTFSGGDDDNMSSKNVDFLLAMGVGGSAKILYVNSTGSCMSVVNTGDISGSRGISVSGAMGFDRSVDTRFYYLQTAGATNLSIFQDDLSAGTANSVNSGGNSIVTFVSNNASAPPLPTWTGTLAVNYVNYPIVSCTGGPPATSCTVFGNTGTLTGAPYAKTDIAVTTLVQNLMAPGVCPGVVPFTVGAVGLLNLPLSGNRFMFMAAPGQQNTADWTFVWDKTLGCQTFNLTAPGPSGYPFLAPGTCSTSACSEAIAPLINTSSGLNTFLNNVNTTTTQTIAPGTQFVTVNSVANMWITQTLVIDTVASGVQETVTIPAFGIGPGNKFKATFANSHASGVPVTYTPNSCFGSSGATGKGIHACQGSLDGNYLLCVPTQPPWTAGGCNTSTIVSQATVMQVGTLNDQWWYGAPDVGYGGPNYSGHPSLGVTHDVAFNYLGPNIRTFANGRSYTVFAPPVVANDSHSGWPHPLGDDSYPVIAGTDTQLSTQGSGCTFPATCPINQVNVIEAFFPNAVNQTPTQFFHTYSCNGVGAGIARCPSNAPDSYFGSQFAIGFVSQDANWFCWSSSMLQGLGNDTGGKYFAGLFCGKLQ